MDRRDVLALSGALAAAALAGCAGGPREPADTDRPTETGRAPATDTASGTATEPSTLDRTKTPMDHHPTGTPSARDDRIAELAAGNAGFALDLHRHLAGAQGGNLFLSPYSISVALAMTYAGAGGETEAQMREALRYTLGADVHPAFADLRAALEARETTEDPEDDDEVDAFRLSVANALWGQEGYPFDDGFLALLEEHYEAGLRRADFDGDPEGERERINEWVADETEGRIDDLLPPDSITPGTVLVLTNAIYFMAGWQFEFDPADTEAGTFTALDGSRSTVPFMHQHVRTNYANLPRAQAVELPYVGGEVSMVLVLPDEGEFEAVEQGLDADRLFGIFDALEDAAGDVVLPKFEFETEVQLSEALADLGMPDAFGPGADFDGMVEGDGGPWIDEVYHDSFVSVDEEGTEAAASTAVAMIVSMPPQWGELRFDRPFLFCIRDRPTDAVLFMGRVVDAGAAQGDG